MSQLQGCETCPIYIKFMDDTEERLHEAATHLVEIVGQDAVDAWVQSERSFIEQVDESKESCPGHKAIGNFMRKAILFFDGQAGLGFAETMRCNNSAIHGQPAATLKAERKEFDALIESAVLAKD